MATLIVIDVIRRRFIVFVSHQTSLKLFKSQLIAYDDVSIYLSIMIYILVTKNMFQVEAYQYTCVASA